MAETIVSPENEKVDVVKVGNDAVAEFKKQQKKIFDWVANVKNDAWRAIAHKVAEKHVAGDANFEEFRTEALNSFEKAQPVENPNPEIGMGKKDRKRFSLRKLFLEIGTKGGPTGLEKEACTEARETLRKLGDSTINDREGITLPEDILNASMAEDNDLNSRGMEQVIGEVRQLKRGLTAGTQNTGGYLVGTDLLTGSIIELLRVATIVDRLGITVLDGLVNNVAIPRVLTGSTVYWLAEAASVTASNQTFGQLTLVPHRMGADTFYTKQLLNQASLSVEAFVRDDLVRQMAVELDRVYIQGTGLVGEPTGIFNTSGVGTISYSATPTWAKLLTQESDIATANAVLGQLSWLFTPAARAKLKAAVAFQNTASPLWDSQNMVNGYPAYISNNLPGNKSVFGVFSEFIAARWAGLDVVVDPYSLKKTEQIEVTMHQWVDCGIRHPLAFEISTDSAAQ